MWAKSKESGFTIVELLIVVVVIAILAAITIVAFSGIQQRAKLQSTSATAAQAIKKIGIYAAQNNDQFPPDLATFLATGIKASPGDTLGYVYNYDGTGNSYCVSVSNSAGVSSATNTSSVVPTGCLASSGVIAWWPLNGDTTDVTSGNNGTIVGTATTMPNSTGQAGMAYALNASAYVSIPQIPLGGVSSFTISGWLLAAGFNTNNQAPLVGTFSSSGGLLNALHIGLRASQPFMGYFSSDYGAGSALTLNQWYHLVFVQNGSGTRQLFVNGVLVGTSSVLPLYKGQFDTLGSNCCMNGNLNGGIDDIRVYNRALSTTEVSSLYASGPR